MIHFNNSPIQKVQFNEHNFYIKRDDLIHKDFSGNKARKFYYLLNSKYKNIKKIISHGSNQSNAMYSLSVLCRLKGWKFDYYLSDIPKYLENNPIGNYKNSLDNGMNVIISSNIPNIKSEDNSILFINEGGAVKKAQEGIKLLANEINNWIIEDKLTNVKVFLPSGTGTTALFLQKYLDIEVLTCPCVGDEIYLEKQFFQLQEDKKIHPTILKPPRKFHFGKLYKENYLIWNKLLNQTKIEFDLLYDPIGWQTLLKYQNYLKNYTILYIHQGGIKGNETMKLRYERKSQLRS